MNSDYEERVRNYKEKYTLKDNELTPFEQDLHEGEMVGRVKWFSQEKGYGFILGQDGTDRYVHHRNIAENSPLWEGDVVAFKHAESKKGARAEAVRVLRTKRKIEDRAVCKGCGRKMIPRVIFSGGVPDYSICPFCGVIYKKFMEKGCFIATVVYGSPYARQVQELRNFRDDILLKSAAGKAFVRFYYHHSPKIARWLEGKKLISSIIRVALEILLVAIVPFKKGS